VGGIQEKEGSKGERLNCPLGRETTTISHWAKHATKSVWKGEEETSRNTAITADLREVGGEAAAAPEGDFDEEL